MINGHCGDLFHLNVFLSSVDEWKLDFSRQAKVCGQMRSCSRRRWTAGGRREHEWETNQIQDTHKAPSPPPPKQTKTKPTYNFLILKVTCTMASKHSQKCSFSFNCSFQCRWDRANLHMCAHQTLKASASLQPSIHLPDHKHQTFPALQHKTKIPPPSLWSISEDSCVFLTAPFCTHMFHI